MQILSRPVEVIGENLENMFSISFVTNQPKLIKTSFCSFSYFIYFWPLAKLIYIIFPATFKKQLLISLQISFGFIKIWFIFLNLRYFTGDDLIEFSLCKFAILHYSFGLFAASSIPCLNQATFCIQDNLPIIVNLPLVFHLVMRIK